MIKADQPDIFGPNLVAGVSSWADGTMRAAPAANQSEVGQVGLNRRRFLAGLAIDYQRTVRVRVTYDRHDFTVNREVSSTATTIGATAEASLQPADALATTDKGIALFLPLADCVGAVIYDPVKEV